MKTSRLSRALTVVILSIAGCAMVGCASSKMTSNPQTTSEAKTPTKEYEWHDMSLGKNFYGSSLSTTAQAQQAQEAQQK
jgi:hypothetical protein